MSFLVYRVLWSDHGENETSFVEPHSFILFVQPMPIEKYRPRDQKLRDYFSNAIDRVSTNHIETIQYMKFCNKIKPLNRTVSFWNRIRILTSFYAVFPQNEGSPDSPQFLLLSSSLYFLCTLFRFLLSCYPSRSSLGTYNRFFIRNNYLFE